MLSDSVRVLLISGSTRNGSANSAALVTAAALAPRRVTPVLYGGLADLPAFNPDHDGDLLPPAAAALRGEIGAAAAVLFCTPEYAGTLPGSLKNLLDWTVGGGEMNEKPAAWINVAEAGPRRRRHGDPGLRACPTWGPPSSSGLPRHPRTKGRRHPGRHGERPAVHRDRRGDLGRGSRSPGRRVVTALSIPLFAFFAVLTVLMLAAGLRRLMGMRLSPLRTLIAALIALFSASPIITAMAGPALSSKNPGVLPGLWFVILGVVIAMLVGMIFLVISEALVPSGSLPGPLYVLRGARRLGGRTRRYSQISRILARHGLLPYLRGGRRAELATADGRARLARSLRLALEDGGVTFVKLGQVLSTRRDLLPPEFIAELSRLQDDAPRVPWPDDQGGARGLARRAGEREVRQLRRGADRRGLHRPGAPATLPSGERVVVKVRGRGPPAWPPPTWTSCSGWRPGCSAAPAGAGRSARSTWPGGSPTRCARNSTCGSRRGT